MVRNHRSANGGNVTGKRRSDEVVNVAGINVTHPQKIWLPEEKITKLDVVSTMPLLPRASSIGTVNINYLAVRPECVEGRTADYNTVSKGR
jgi:hypothetical protein